MKFNQVFHELRKSRGMTQEELAKALGVSRSTIGMYEQGKREPDFETEEKIADYFNVTLDFLRTGGGSAVPTDGQPVWYLDDEATAFALEFLTDPEKRVLLDSVRKLAPEDIRLANEILQRLKGTNDG